MLPFTLCVFVLCTLPVTLMFRNVFTGELVKAVKQQTQLCVEFGVGVSVCVCVCVCVCACVKEEEPKENMCVVCICLCVYMG